MKFSIWYNEQESFYDILEKYKDNISTVYFGAPTSLWPSGRAIIQDENYDNQIKKLLTTCS